MTPEEINMAMAEGSGWCEPWAYPGIIPNYYRDLNAAHEVRMWAISGDLKLRVDHQNHLRAIVSRRTGKAASDYELLDSEASEQCEAILRTLGKWKDQQ